MPGELPAMQSKAISESVGRAANDYFRLCVLTLDQRHLRRSFRAWPPHVVVGVYFACIVHFAYGYLVASLYRMTLSAKTVHCHSMGSALTNAVMISRTLI